MTFHVVLFIRLPNYQDLVKHIALQRFYTSYVKNYLSVFNVR